MDKMILNVASIFQNGMVLQRNKPVAIWGEARPKKMVKISIQGKSVECISDEKGKWLVNLSDLKASVKEELIVESGDERIVFTDIAVGEVWLAGGQSNMEFYMYYDKDYESVLPLCNDQLIRFYDVPKVASDEHKARFSYDLFGKWRKADEENLKYFSAVAYYFAKSLKDDLNVPIGIIGCNWGGSRAACWMDKQTVEKYGSVWLQDYEKGLLEIKDMDSEREAYFSSDLSDPMKVFDDEIRNKLLRGVPEEELLRFVAQWQENGNGPVIGPWHEWRPTCLYEHMIKTIVPFSIKGVIYYQGESDENHPDIYENMLEGLVGCWRKAFNQDIPFIMTMLAPFEGGGENYVVLRSQQKLATQRISNLWCASIGDVGNSYDIHPKEKRPVGKRLALLARGHVYHEDILCDAPVGKSLSWDEDRLVIECHNVDGGLFVQGENVSCLSVCDSLENEIDKSTYKVSTENNGVAITFDKSIKDKKCKVKYAQSPYYEVNIYNMAEIPMLPFVLEI